MANVRVEQNIVVEDAGHEFRIDGVSRERFDELSFQMFISPDKKKAVVGFLEANWEPWNPREDDDGIFSKLLIIEDKFSNLSEIKDYDNVGYFLFDKACSLDEDFARENGHIDFDDSVQDVVDKAEKIVLKHNVCLSFDIDKGYNIDFSIYNDMSGDNLIIASKEKIKNETLYSEDELFNKDKHRTPKVGEGVKLKNRDSDFGKIKEIKDDGSIVVDFDYNKALDFRKSENIVISHLDEVAEVRSNRAEQMLKAELKEFSAYLSNDGHFVRILEYENVNGGENPEWEFKEDLSEGVFVLGHDEADKELDIEFSCDVKRLINKSNDNASDIRMC